MGDSNHKPSFWYFSNHFLKKLIAKPFPFAQSGGYLILASLHVRRFWLARVHCAHFAKAMDMAYNRGRESSLASMGKEKEEGKGKDPWPGEPLDLEQLSDASNAENAIIKLKNDPAFTLNQTEIDYSMLFRVKELDFINAVRQVYDIKAGSHAERVR